MICRTATACFLTAFLISGIAQADVVLIFDQSGGTGNLNALDQDYGDRVTAATDSNGHHYNIISGAGLGLTPNVEAIYGPGIPRLWTTGYGNLTNVYYDQDGNNSALEMTLIADQGFEVGLFGFDLAGWVSGLMATDISVVDENDNVLWSNGPTLLNELTFNDFDFSQGLFAQSLTISVELGGALGQFVAMDNVHFAQRSSSSSVPEPAIIPFLAMLGLGFVRRRRAFWSTGQ